MSNILMTSLYLTAFLIMKPYLTKRTKFDTLLWFNMIVLWVIAFIEQFTEISASVCVAMVLSSTVFAILYTMAVRKYRSAEDIDTGVAGLFGYNGKVKTVTDDGNVIGTITLWEGNEADIMVECEEDVAEGDGFVISNYDHNNNKYIVTKT